MSTTKLQKCFIYSISLAAILFLTFSLAPVSRAQSTVAGAIGGTVTDPSSGVVANAMVTIHNNDTNAEQTVTTDPSGYSSGIAELQPGTYTVTVQATGFAAYKAEQVVVAVGAVTEFSAQLAVASAGQTVLVTATTPQVNTTSSRVCSAGGPFGYLRASEFNARGGPTSPCSRRA